MRKAYGKVVGYLKQWPEERAGLTDELDRTPNDMPQAWYVAFLCGQLEQRMQEKLKVQITRVITDKEIAPLAWCGVTIQGSAPR